MTAAAPAGRELTARLAAFTALAAIAAWAWARLVAEPPAGRIVLAVVALSAGAALVALIGAADLGRARSWALAALATVLAAAAGLVAIGVRPDQLLPGGWDVLADRLGRGFEGLDGDVEYPFAGRNSASRLVLLAGLPVAVAFAAALAFWPRRRERGSRVLGLAVLIAIWAFAATAVPPGAPLLWGLLLLAGVAAWLWAPRLARRDAIPAVALVAVAGAVAVVAAGALDADEPLIDYEDWKLAAGGGEGFDWDHDYGPLDWPRDGSTMLRVTSGEPHYWRASVLDEFDGTRWLQPEDSAGRRLEVPSQVEEGAAEVDRGTLNPDWVESVDVAVGSLRSDLLIAPGTAIQVSGLDDVDPRPDGTVALGDELDDGDVYTAVAYVPDPSPARMRRAPDRYPPVLAPYTQIELPPPPAGQPGPLGAVDMPLRGSFGARDELRAERAWILASPYAPMYRLARRLTAGEADNYRAVMAIESHLRSDRFKYRESVGGTGPYPLVDFVHRDRRGYCQQFSGAMALMLRMAGIPSRVVTGFTAGTEDPGAPSQHVVTDLDAHSWVEVYFTGIGWVPFEPTPSRAPASSQLGEGGLAGGPGSTARPPRPPARGGTSDAAASPTPAEDGGAGWLIFLGATALLGVGAAISVAGRARRFRSLPPAAAAEAQLRELERGLERFGLAIGPGETLYALERRLRDRRRPATADYASKLRSGRFEAEGVGPPQPAERRAVRRELRSKRASGGRLRALLAFPLGGPREGSDPSGARPSTWHRGV